MTLVIGAGEKHHKDATHIDIRESAKPDIVHDLNERPWPIDSESVHYVIAEDIIEHLDDVVSIVEEIHRILEPNGKVYITTAHYMHENSWHDPTHKWHLSEQSFDYFDPDTAWGKKYGYYSDKKFHITHKTVAGGNVVIEMEKRNG